MSAEGLNLAAAFIAALIVIWLISAAMACAAVRKLEVSISTSGNIKKKGNSASTIRVRNGNRYPVPVMLLRCIAENTYTGQSETRLVRMSVAAGREESAQFEVSTEFCGKIRCSIVRVGAADMFGVFRKWRAEDRYCNYTVLPEMFPTEMEYALHESDLYDSETYSPYRKGSDYSETFQIREYEPGDDLRHVHWKLSGKSEEMLVKEASYPMDRSMLVIMDKSTQADVEPETAEALAEITVSVCEGLLEEGLDFRVAWNDVNAGNCFCSTIQHQEELAGIIPQMLTSPVKKSDRSCGELYRQIIGADKATHVIYAACGQRPPGALYFEESSVTCLDACAQGYKELYRTVNLY